MIDSWARRFGLPVEILPDDRFVCSILEFQTWAQARGDLMMEFFYRDMRRKTGLLMSADGKPKGGLWNLDKANRASPKRGLNFPEPMRFDPDEITSEVMTLVAERFAGHFGRLEASRSRSPRHRPGRRSRISSNRLARFRDLSGCHGDG